MPEWLAALITQIVPVIGAGGLGGALTLVWTRKALRRRADAEAMSADASAAAKFESVAGSAATRWSEAMHMAEVAIKESRNASDEAAEARRELNIIRLELAECLRDRSAIKARLDVIEAIMSHPEVAAKIRELGIAAPLLAVLLGGYVAHLLLIAL